MILKAVVVREGDSRTTIVEFPEPTGVVDRHDPDMDWMTDEQVIGRIVYQMTGVNVGTVEVVESDGERIRYTIEVP